MLTSSTFQWWKCAFLDEVNIESANFHDDDDDGWIYGEIASPKGGRVPAYPGNLISDTRRIRMMIIIYMTQMRIITDDSSYIPHDEEYKEEYRDDVEGEEKVI